MDKKIGPLDALNVAATVVGGPAVKAAQAAGKVKQIVGIAKSLGALFGKKRPHD